MKQRFYAAFWTILTLVVVSALVLVAFRANFRANQRDINPEAFQPPPAPQHAQSAVPSQGAAVEGLPDVEVKQTQIVLSSPDGQMKLRLYSRAATASEGTVELPQAKLEFFFADEKKLFLLARNVRYEMHEQTAVVEGELSGEIPALRERFTAKGLTWDRRTHTLTLKQATLVDPAFRTEAQDIRLDVKNDLLEITGGVSVEI